MVHRINKLLFETTCTKETEALEIRGMVSRLSQKETIDIIDSVCNQQVTEAEEILIDKIIVDLGRCKKENFEKQFIEQFALKFKNEIASKVKPIPTSEKRRLKQYSKLKAFLIFLKTGIFPWWSNETETDIHKIFHELGNEYAEVIKIFLSAHRHDSNIWKRLSFQLNETGYDILFIIIPELTLFEKFISEWLQEWSENMKLTLPSWHYELPDSAIIRKSIICYAHLFLSTHDNIKTLKQEFRAMLNQLSINPPDDDQLAEKFVNTDGPSIQFPDVTTAIQDLQDEFVGEEYVSVEQFHIQTSGIVLLGPYLTRFFTHLRLLKVDEWKDADSQFRAIQLLRYLGTGELKTQEHHLVFEKLICGLDIIIPVPGDIELTPQEISESADLLKSVISNWKALKNTSIEGLRETFLKRDGILIKKDNDWLLKIERKTVDILLESLPWNYSTLKLPWRYNLIFTEW